MASARERQRNNVRAGIFVSIAGILALGVLLALSDLASIFQRSTAYSVTFPVSAGVGDLTAGSAVRVGGLKLGRVTAVRPLIDVNGAARLDTIAVDFDLDARITLYDNARLLVESPLLGSDAWIRISNVGDSGTALPARAVLAGATSPGMLTNLLGPENARKTDEVVENLREFTAFLTRVETEYDARVQPILDEFGLTAKEFRALVARVTGEDWPRWAANVDDIFAGVERIARNVDEAVTDSRNLMSGADGSIERINRMIDENRPDIDAFIDRMNEIGVDVQRLVGRVQEETIDRVHAFLDRGGEGIESFTETARRINAELDVIFPDVEATMANARIASEQLKLTTIEVRRSPWKLLYQPSAGEFEHELLYESARSFAVAASDLKAASEAVDRVMTNHRERLLVDEATAARLRDHLLDSFARYERAQQRLLDVLILDRP